MPRPKTKRSIAERPEITWFKPAGVPLRKLDEVVLTLDEMEAMRLTDLDGMYQEKAAEHMAVSRQTVGRILSSAHRKVAEALVKGKAIRIEGGPVRFRGCECKRCADKVAHGENPYCTGESGGSQTCEADA